MGIGLCECPVGLSRGPCKHKAILSKQFNLLSFDIIPTESCEMRAFYHFLGTGQRENPFWYRPLHLPEIDLPAMPEVNEISVQRTSSSIQSCENPQLPAENVNHESPSKKDETTETKTSFLKSVNNLIKVLEDRYENDSDNYSKAMSAFTRQCDIIVNSSDAAIQKALHTFAKENTKAVLPGKKKNSGRIPVQSKSKARRNYTMRGSGSRMKGRPTKDLPQTSTKTDNVVYHSLPKQKNKMKKRPHCLTTVVKVNLPTDKKH